VRSNLGKQAIREKCNQDKMHITVMSTAIPDQEEQINNLVNQIVDLPEGMLCFLYDTTYGRECVWDEIGKEMLYLGNKILAWYYDKKKVASIHAKMHHAAHYHLYMHYSCIIVGYRNVHVCIPNCIEKYIKLAYPGNKKFVGFKESYQ